MPKGEVRSEYSIAAVSKLTGVSCHALRIWERRYGYPVPRRSPSGHRRYGADQVEALRVIAHHMQGGRSVGDLIAETLAEQPDIAAPAGPPASEGAGPSPSALTDRLMDCDDQGAESDYRRAADAFTPSELIENLVEPALIDVGERWFRGECSIFQERSATVFLRRKLDGLLDEVKRANARPGRLALVGAVQGERHEAGVLMLAIMLELAGWRAVPLGVDLPVREFRGAVEAWRPDALALSFVMSRNINKRFRELSEIPGVPIFVGGRSILNYQGLARRHGLIPLSGPVSRCTGPLLTACERWRAGHPASPA